MPFVSAYRGPRRRTRQPLDDAKDRCGAATRLVGGLDIFFTSIEGRPLIAWPILRLPLGPAACATTHALTGLTDGIHDVRERRISETGSDRQYRPMGDVLHERNFAETLHHRVVVHDDR